MTWGRDISLREAARRLGVSPQLLRERILAGDIPTAYRTSGGQYRMQEYGIEEWTRERTHAG